MPPYQTEELAQLSTEISTDTHLKDEFQTEKNCRKYRFTQQPPVWDSAIVIILFHIIALYACTYTLQTKLLTVIWGFIVGIFAGFGVTAGAHRLWTHRSYKAKLPLQIILLLGYATSGMNSLFNWVRDHRVHHKFSETDADPHNSRRGFFFSHVGWLMQKKHPEVIRKGRSVDMSDITSDPLLVFYDKYFIVFKILFCFILPSLVPKFVWNESWLISVGSQTLVRYMFTLNSTWSVNSFAHIWGKRPYDKRIQPAENITVAICTLGEGWHNYHHVFPWDYRAAELGNYKLNFTTMLLDQFSKIGWAYDMKKPSQELIQTTISKYGDGSYVAEVPYEDKEK